MTEKPRKDRKPELQAVVAELTRLEGEVVHFFTTFGQALDSLREQVQLLLAAPAPAAPASPAAPAPPRAAPTPALAPAESPTAETAAPPDEGGAAGEEEGPRGRVLLVDDEAFILTVIRDMFEAKGFEVLTAKNGLEGIAQAQQGNPDVIVLDVMMSGIDGYETCRRLKKDEQTKDIPVIMLTALENEKFDKKAFQAGAAWTVRKSLDPAKLVSTVGLALSSRRRKPR
jgi:CheY-like chemotaxis protein